MIPFNQIYFTGKEQQYLQKAIKNNFLQGNGPFTHACEIFLEKKLSCRKILLTHSGTAALEMASLLLGLKPGDEVILPSFTFVSTANAFVLRNAIPVFVDIRPDTLNLNEALIEKAITSRTRAICVVHYGGVPCEMDAILKIAHDRNLFVIEDAAQAVGSLYHNQAAGTIGDLGCFSFHETKNIIAGEGGALCINNDSLRKRADIIWEKGTNRKAFLCGEVDKYTWVDVGSSFLPSELTAAFLLAQLEKMDLIIEKRRKIINLYQSGLANALQQNSIKTQFVPTYIFHNAHLFGLLFKNKSTRQNFIAGMLAEKIKTVTHYVALHSSPFGKIIGKTVGHLDVTDSVANQWVRLPLFTSMTEENIQQVLTATNRVISSL